MLKYVFIIIRNLILIKNKFNALKIFQVGQNFNFNLLNEILKYKINSDIYI
jgi:hypothetical protein